MLPTPTLVIKQSFGKCVDVIYSDLGMIKPKEITQELHCPLLISLNNMHAMFFNLQIANSAEILLLLRNQKFIKFYALHIFRTLEENIW